MTVLRGVAEALGRSADETVTVRALAGVLDIGRGALAELDGAGLVRIHLRAEREAIGLSCGWHQTSITPSRRLSLQSSPSRG